MPRKHGYLRAGASVAALVLHIAALTLAGTSTAAIAAEPIRVARYDDADEFLPNAQRRNKDNIRLVLSQQAGEDIFKVLTPRNVTVDVVANVPSDANAAVILFVGGTSVLSIVNEKLDRSFSFQPRSRDQWWANKFATFLVDAPSDRLGKEGIQDGGWRSGLEHRTDLVAVLDAVAKRFPGPIVVQGHSAGAISVANLAGLRDPRVKAYAYSSPQYSYLRSRLPLYAEVNHFAPVIFLEHRKDLCTVSAPKDVESLFASINATSKKMLWLEGGSDPLSGPCGPFAAHSYFGVEGQAINMLATELRKSL